MLGRLLRCSQFWWPLGYCPHRELNHHHGRKRVGRAGRSGPLLPPVHVAVRGEVRMVISSRHYHPQSPGMRWPPRHKLAPMPRLSLGPCSRSQGTAREKARGKLKRERGRALEMARRRLEKACGTVIYERKYKICACPAISLSYPVH